MTSPSDIAVERLLPHPQNPRLEPRQDVVEQIAAQIRARGEFDPAHALIVRPVDGSYQIVSGHHRKLAGEAVGLATLPCWVREMADDEAYMALVLANTQGELHPLEEGLHALGSGMSVRSYADASHMTPRKVQIRREAAEVFQACNLEVTAAKERTKHLAEIHSASSWLWPALAAELVARGWTVEATRGKVAALKEVPQPPEWSNAEAVGEAIVAGTMKPADVVRMAAVVANAKLQDEDLREELASSLAVNEPGSVSAVQKLVAHLEDLQAERIRAAREAERAEQEAKETASKARAQRRESLLNFVNLKQWATLDAEEREDVLGGHGETGRAFNKQDNADIEWAQWSWNPITGCLHDCPYCYARDIAFQRKMEVHYPNGFEPTLKPRSLLTPRGKKPPKTAETDGRYRNVFTGSMADIFGRWVPEEWINAVLREIRAAPEWNFLCLTKFPKRMAEFDIPPNAWMGTTVDLQARVAPAEAGFAKVKSGVRWLSIEPMLEPLRFKRLDLFDWIVIGGSTRSSKTPDWHPPYEWVKDLETQAREAGIPVYMKSNLFGASTARVLELPQGLPVTPDIKEAPEVFHYLGRRSDRDKLPEAA